MKQRLSCLFTAFATLLATLALVGASPSTSAQRQSSSLSITPKVFVGGQALRFVGRIAGAPRKKVRIQTRTNRSGDSWITRAGTVGSTNGKGQFNFVYRAPNNFGISYRVRASNGRTSPVKILQPRQQEVVLSLNGGAPQKSGAVAAGARFVIKVDTTHTGRGDLGRPAPAFPGRQLALQQRGAGGGWSTVDVAYASNLGTARFERYAGNPGKVVYRVRQGDIRSGGNKIGWFPSFPLEVRVVNGRAAARTSTPSTTTRTVATTPQFAARTSQYTKTPTTSGKYKWGPPAFDFAWVDGESLTDAPYRGTRRKGRWLDGSNGSGRASHYNGGMALSTNVSDFAGRGDHGTTSATLQGNALTYGRWEFRRRIDVFEKKGRNYRVNIDLVPERAQDRRCGTNIIKVASVGFNSRKAKIGVKSARANKSWSGSRRIPRLSGRPHSFGVEVTRGHISWFLDGRTLATVKNRKAVPGVPLTPRLSLVGRKQKEMQRTRVLYDWQRGWPLNKQAKKAKAGPGLKAKKLSGGC